MDPKTLEKYNLDANEINQRHLNQCPSRLYDLAKAFFLKNETTLDLGCGSGRDTAWLTSNSYPAHGTDASNGMLEQAKNNFKELSTHFFESSLPALKEIKDASYNNIFCSAVLMHVPSKDILTAIYNILRVTKDGGIIVLSFRDSLNNTLREDDRLFESYSIGHISQLFESFGGKVLFTEAEKSELKEWKTLVIRKMRVDQKSGIARIQDILEKDSKVTTYKFALIRALTEISRYETAIVQWNTERDMVGIPMKRIAHRWVAEFFWIVDQWTRSLRG